MATRLKPVDVVVIGVGWAGSILAKELAQAGLKVVGLERGGYRGQEDFTLPGAHDHLKYDRRLELFENLSRTTITCRNSTREVARPMRRHGPFPWGEGLGGAGFHWAGWTWRHTPWNFQIRSRTMARYGERAIPEDSTIQDTSRGIIPSPRPRRRRAGPTRTPTACRWAPVSTAATA